MFLENLKYLLSKNDPSFQYETSQSYTVAGREQPKWKPREAAHNTTITTNKTDITQSVFEDTKLCPIHGINHSLNDCRTFRSKSLTERKQFLKENGLCYKCCGTAKHMAKDCRVRTVICGICRSNHHPTGLHEPDATRNQRSSSMVSQGWRRHGGEDKAPTNNVQVNTQQPVVSKCTQICKDGASRKSCAKIVQVKVYHNDQPEKAIKTYCIIDDQSNRSLARSEFFDIFGEQGSEIQYTLSSCSGTHLTSGRRASNYIIESLDGQTVLHLPTLNAMKSQITKTKYPQQK